jgi:hypothetical protein
MKSKMRNALSIVADLLLLIGVGLALWLLNLFRDPWKLGVIVLVLALGFAVRRTKPDFVRGVWAAGGRWVGRIIAGAVILLLAGMLAAAFFWFRAPVKTAQGDISRWEFVGRLAAAARTRTCRNEISMVAPFVLSFPMQVAGGYSRLSLEIDDDSWERISKHPANITERKFAEGMIPFTAWMTGIEVKSIVLFLAGSGASRCEWPDGYYDFFRLKELEDLSPGHPQDVFSVIEEQMADMTSGAPGKE